MSEPAIEIKSLGKMYKLFKGPKEKVMDAFGLGRLFPWRGNGYQEFWALRDLSIEVKRGERLGILGRNGVGKSTLLKVISGNIAPTEGDVKVNGRVQALLDMGTGFHPEFTGRQNIGAALSYLGFTSKKIAELEEDIVDFAELEDFIDQPLKTYSSGMQARLAFSTATVIEPDILIVDEILGVGDAYFISKCVDRMRGLTRAGTTFLLVSHAMSQILQFCDRAIWIDRGMVVQEGPSMEVVKAYDRHTQMLENRRLMAKNLKSKSSKYKVHELDNYADYFLLRIALPDAAGTPMDVRCMRLLKDSEVIDELLLGAPQDANPLGYSSYLPLSPQESWSAPRNEDGVSFRSLEASGPGAEVFGNAMFHLYVREPEAQYELEVEYRYEGNGTASVELSDKQQHQWVCDLPPGGPSWTNSRLPLSTGTEPDREAASKSMRSACPGTNEILIRKVSLLSKEGKESALFKVGDPMTIVFDFECQKDGTYPVILNVVIYRLDGIRVSCHISEEQTLRMTAGQTKRANLVFPRLNLGNGNYVSSPAIYRTLDRQAAGHSEYYDLIDRSYEFQVFGNEAIDESIFHHPYEWVME